MVEIIRAYFMGALTAFKNIQPTTRMSDEMCRGLALEQTSKYFDYPIDELEKIVALPKPLPTV